MDVRPPQKRLGSGVDDLLERFLVTRRNRRSGSTPETLIRSLLEPADIRIGGDRPWDLQIHHEDFFRRVLSNAPALALGESYMDGWWDVEQLDEFFYRLLAAHIDERVQNDPRLRRQMAGQVLRSLVVNQGRRSKAFEIGRRHYDIGNDLYRSMLDRRLTYTCGYWQDAATLDEAQEAKLDLVCRKIGIEAGMRVLDIGCGWGSFAGWAAERYGAEVVGVTVSEKQVELGRDLYAGLPVEFRLQDYRDVHDGPYDRIVSLGMIEHVGYRNYRSYFEVARRLLAPEGLFLLHTIGATVSVRGSDPWTERYIFPNSMLPSLAQLSRAIERLFVIEDLHNFGADYDRTLMSWHANIERSWPTLDTHYDERFRRMWRYYLLSSAGSFRARRPQLWQLVLSPRGVPGGYVSIR